MGSISAALGAASASLLGAMPVHANESPWLVDSALLMYSESDGRVQAVEPIVSMKKDMGDEHYLNLKFTLDTLTGASPNGAIPSKETKTFTGPSGKSNYTIASGKQPLDDSFHDTRAAFNIGWEQPLGDNNRVSVGANYSKEYDFSSAGINAAIARDFNSKNTTLSLGLNLESDTVNAVGGIPEPLSYSLSSVNNGDNSINNLDRKSSDTKKVNDILLGVTQIINRHWLTQLNYSYSAVSGYQNDPYKILSVVDVNGNLVNNPDNMTNDLSLYENRPDTRKRQSIFWNNKIHLTEDVIDISVRHYSDDWGIKSNSIDMRYRYQIGSQSYLEPHYRYYTQTAADFYHPFLVSGTNVVNREASVDYASSDPRLAKFNATTLGIKWGYVLGSNSEFNIRVEQYKQVGTSMPSEAKNMSALSGLDLYPGLKATSVLVGYSFEF